MENTRQPLPIQPDKPPPACESGVTLSSRTTQEKKKQRKGNMLSHHVQISDTSLTGGRARAEKARTSHARLTTESL